MDLPELSFGVWIDRSLPSPQDTYGLPDDTVHLHILMVLRDTVAHDINILAIRGYDAVHYIATAVLRTDMEEDDIVFFDFPRGPEDNEILAASYKREHTVSLDRYCDVMTGGKHFPDRGEELIVI